LSDTTGLLSNILGAGAVGFESPVTEEERRKAAETMRRVLREEVLPTANMAAALMSPTGVLTSPLLPERTTDQLKALRNIAGASPGLLGALSAAGETTAAAIQNPQNPMLAMALGVSRKAPRSAALAARSGNVGLSEDALTRAADRVSDVRRMQRKAPKPKRQFRDVPLFDTDSHPLARHVNGANTLPDLDLIVEIGGDLYGAPGLSLESIDDVVRHPIGASKEFSDFANMIAEKAKFLHRRNR